MHCLWLNKPESNWITTCALLQTGHLWNLDKETRLSSELHLFDWSEIMLKHCFWPPTSLTPRSHKEAEEEIHRQHQTHQPEHRFRRNKTRSDNTQEKYRHEAAASYIKWRGLHDKGPPHDNLKMMLNLIFFREHLMYTWGPGLIIRN